jgi:WD40 repeat protein
MSLALSGDGRTFAIRSLRGPVALGDVQTRSLVVRLPDRHPYAAVAFSPEGNLLTVSGLDGSLRVWNVAAGSQSYELPAVLLQKKYGLRLVGVDLVELEPR